MNFETLLLAEEKFFLHYGRTLAEWSSVERALFLWFEQVTQMPAPMARGVLYSSRNFNGRSEMLEAAIAASPYLPHAFVPFISAARKKAIGYNSFRNTLAHGEPAIGANRDGSLTGEVYLVQGKLHPLEATNRAVKLNQLSAATANYRKLCSLLIVVVQHWRVPSMQEDVLSSPDKCLEMLNLLPNQADVLNSETS